MKMQPTEYKPFEDSAWEFWPDLAGAVDIDSLDTLKVKNSRVEVNGVRLHSIAFGRHIWNVPSGWLDRGKPIPTAPGSIMR